MFKLFAKKNEKSSCCCASVDAQSMNQAEKVMHEGASVKVLGTGCAKCQKLEANARKALASLGREEDVEHVSDVAQIAAWGVMTTPALVIDDKVVSYGKVLSPQEIAQLLNQ